MQKELKRQSMYDVNIQTKYAALLLDVSINEDKALIFADEDTLMDMLINDNFWYKHPSAGTIIANLKENQLVNFLETSSNLGTILNQQYNTTVFSNGNIINVYKNVSYSNFQKIKGAFLSAINNYLQKVLLLNNVNAGHYFNELFNMGNSTVNSCKTLADCLNSKTFMSKVATNQKLMRFLKDNNTTVLANTNKMTIETVNLTSGTSYTIPSDTYFIYFDLNAAGGASQSASYTSTSGWECGAVSSAFVVAYSPVIMTYSYKAMAASSNGSSITDYIYVSDSTKSLTYLLGSVNSSTTSQKDNTTLTINGNTYKCSSGCKGGTATSQTVTTSCYDELSNNTSSRTWVKYINATTASPPTTGSITTASSFGNYSTYSQTGGSTPSTKGTLTLKLYRSKAA